MITGHLNRHSSARGPLFLILAAVLVVGVGCGGDDEPEAADPDRGGGMVPAASESSRVDTTFTDAAESEVGMQSETEAATTPAAALIPTNTAEPAAAASQATAEAAAPASQGRISLQLGSFLNAANAARQAERIRELGQAATVEVATLGGETYHRVVIDGLADRAAAERLGEEIRSRLGITYLIRQK